jgi:hypothetical protein
LVDAENGPPRVCQFQFVRADDLHVQRTEQHALIRAEAAAQGLLPGRGAWRVKVAGAVVLEEQSAPRGLGHCSVLSPASANAFPILQTSKTTRAAAKQATIDAQPAAGSMVCSATACFPSSVQKERERFELI